MFCPKCGTQNPEGSRFCTACGQDMTTAQNNQQPANEPKKIQLRCKACGGSMEVQNGQNVFLCPYCGSKEMLVESDKVSVARIQSGAAKDLVFGVMDRVGESKRQKIEEQRRKEEQQREDAKKSIPFFIAILAVLIILAIVMSIREDKKKQQVSATSVESAVTDASEFQTLLI